MNWAVYRRAREAYARQLERDAELLRRQARDVWAKIERLNAMPEAPE